MKTNLEKVRDGGATGADANTYLNQFLEDAKAKGLNVNDLGIEGLTNETDFSYLTDEQKKNIATKLLEHAGD
jgi:hypothetical protein